MQGCQGQVREVHGTGREACLIVIQSMTVAAWEFYALTVMLISTQGDNAEAHATMRLEEAAVRDDRGEMVT